MITMDFESRSVADLPKWGVQRYAEDETTQALCLCWQYDEQPIDDEVHLWHRAHEWVEQTPHDDKIDELIRRIRDGEPIEAHNAGMEFYMWNIALRREFPEFDVLIKPEQLYCSAAKASCLSLPRGLGDAVKALGLPHKKQEAGKMLINKLAKPLPRRKKNPSIRFNEDERLHRLNWDYCKHDVRAERGLSEYCPEMSKREREYWLMDFHMNARGIYLDKEAAEKGLALAAIEARRLNAELYRITGGAVEGFTKRKPLLQWLNARLKAIDQKPLPDTKADTFSFRLIGVPTKAGDEAKEAGKIRMDAEWDALGPTALEIKRAMQIAMEGNRSSNAKYKRMLESVCADNRLHDIMLFNGADRPVAGDAEVLTRDGWRKIEDWTGGEIAQWSHVKGAEGDITFAPATRAEFEHREDMVRLSGPSTELLCTADHKIPTISCRGNLTDRRAGDLRHMNWAIPLGGNLRESFVPEVETRLAVMYQADGRTGRGNLHFKKPRKIARCEMLLRRAGIAYGRTDHADGTTTIQTRNAPEWLERSKSFGPWLLGHSPHAFIDELKHWDGSTDKRNLIPGTSYSTCSRENAEWVQTMASLAGTRAHIEERPERDPNWATSYRVHVHSSGARSWLKRGWNFTREPSTGKVYCARTRTGYFLVRYKGTIQVTGNTGRWSGKGVQPHNFVRGYMAEMCEVWDDLKHLDRDVVELIWGEPTVALAKACRGALTATPGKVLYAADFNAIEARKLAWLSGCNRLLNLFNTPGGDPYLDMASAIYARIITKLDKTERQLGKKAILGLGYAMGWEKFQATVWNDEGIWLDDEFCKRIVNLYRKKMYPEIPALWEASEAAAVAAVRESGEHYCGGNELGIGSVSYFMDRDFLHCRLPSGRLLAYLYPEVHVRLNYRFKAKNARGSDTSVIFPVKRNNVSMFRVRRHAEDMAKKQGKVLTDDTPGTFEQPHLSFMGRDTYTRQWKRMGTHGGTLVENYDQASSRDLLAESMYRIDRRDEFDVLLSIHDEVVAEAAKDACSLGEFETIMAQVPDWAPGMPIKAEGWIGERLRK